MDAYLSAIYAKLDKTPRSLAIKYKLRRFSGARLLAEAAAGHPNPAAYWDALVADPIAPHGGAVTRVATGPLYHPGKLPTVMGAIKFPELTGAGCQSLDVTAPDYEGPAPRCDTVVFGCYVKDALRTIKYFHEPREFVKEEVSSFEEPMIVGAWEKTTTTGVSGLMGKVYTSDSDDRQEQAPSTSAVKIIGRDLGYGEPAWATPGALMRVGSLSRARYYEHRAEVRTQTGASLAAGALVPVFARDCIHYAMRQSATMSGTEIGTALHAMADPTSYEFWTHDDIFHYLGATGSGNKGFPSPAKGAPVWLDTMNYSPFPGSDFSDSGDWFGFTPPFMDVSGVVAPYTSRGGTIHANGVVIGGTPPGWRPYSFSESAPGKASGRVDVALPRVGAVTAHKRLPDDWYFDFSPVEAGGLVFFYRDACWNAIGASEFTSVSEPDEQGKRKRWGRSSLSSADSARHFIGVIHE
jgi:hypothetical protein